MVLAKNIHIRKYYVLFLLRYVDQHCLVNPTRLVGFKLIQMFTCALFLDIGFYFTSLSVQTRWIDTIRHGSLNFHWIICVLPIIPTLIWLQPYLVGWKLVYGRYIITVLITDTRIITWASEVLKKNWVSKLWTTWSQAFHQITCQVNYHSGGNL